eukprot:5541952-Pyramimonas_sp.AAC.1
MSSLPRAASPTLPGFRVATASSAVYDGKTSGPSAAPVTATPPAHGETTRATEAETPWLLSTCLRGNLPNSM